MNEYIISDGGAGAWVIPMITILGVVLVITAFFKGESKRDKIITGVVGLGLICMTLYFYLQPPTTITLTEEEFIIENPWFSNPDMHVDYGEVTWYRVCNLHQLGKRQPVSRVNGYSDGTIRQGWFKTKDEREAYVYTTGERVLAIETHGGMFILSPDGFNNFVDTFETFFDEY